MEMSDVIWSVLILCGTVYLLYRSLWKKKGHCPGCHGGGPCGKINRKTLLSFDKESG